MSEMNMINASSQVSTDNHGFISQVILNGCEIPFRNNPWCGPMWRLRYGGEEHLEAQSARSDGNGMWVLKYWQVVLRKCVYVEAGELVMRLEAKNAGSQPFYPDSLGITLGVDSYMEHYPQWNDKFFPTMLRCEKTHFYGYFATPEMQILAVCCPQPISSWQIHYNEGAQWVEGGHRVDGVTLHLMSQGPLPSHHPIIDHIEPGETKVWEIRFSVVDSVDKALLWAANTTGAAIFVGEKLIFEPEDKANLTFYAKEHIAVTCNGLRLPASQATEVQYTASINGMIAGETYALNIESNGKISEVLVYCRHPWSWYLRHAAEEAVRCEQKATSHIESWYGYFSGLLAMRYCADPVRDSLLLENMNRNIPLAYDMSTGNPTVIPKRIQNTAGVVSFSVDAWQATHDEKWLTLAEGAADFLIDECQDNMGVFRSGRRHYTCVVYIAKSIQELWLAERVIPGHEARAEKYYSSVRRAIDDLVKNSDNIGTEGQPTFEDGMIACSMTQISFFALYLPPEEREPYIEAAEKLLRKHRCLERMGSPDSRSRNTTIRFWESQYDILVLKNMITSPHGWSAWKAYGVWYLYLLTGKVEYLTDVMELLGSCAQLIDENGRMNWAFIVDPYVHTNIMKPDEKGYARPEISTFGECYLPTISGWYKAPRDMAAFGYLGEYRGFDTDQGGCCDNDVHEWVKAMGEIALTHAFIFEDNDGLKCWNLSVKTDGLLEITLHDETVTAVHFNLLTEREVTVKFAHRTVAAHIKYGWLYTDGTVYAEIADRYDT